MLPDRVSNPGPLTYDRLRPRMEFYQLCYRNVLGQMLLRTLFTPASVAYILLATDFNLEHPF